MALLALALAGRLQAAETGTAVDKDPDTGSVDGELTFFGVKATRDTPPGDDELRRRVEQKETDPYRTPNPENCGFSPDNLSLSGPQRDLLTGLLQAVASNFPYGSDRVPSYQKQMALALAIRLAPDNQRLKLADYQLRRMRDPERVPGHETRKDVAAKLWNAGLGLHRFSESDDDRLLARCLIDLARHFEPDNTLKISAANETGAPGEVSSRWESVTDVPPWPEPERMERPVETQIVTTAPPEPTDETFSFPSKSAGLQILQTNGETAEMTVEAIPLKEVDRKLRKTGHQTALIAEPAHEILSPLAETALLDGTRIIDQRFPDWRNTGDFLQFTLKAPVTPDAEYSTGLGAAVLTEAIAGDVEIDANFRLAAALHADGTLAPRPDFSALIESLTVEEHAAQIVAVSPAQEAALLDAALLGNLMPLLTSHFIAAGNSGDALALANTKTRPASVTEALKQFTRVQNLTKGMLPRFIVANAHVRDKLRTILVAVPNHLSASVLLRAGDGELPDTLSLPGSLTQLQKIEEPIRDLLAARNQPAPEEGQPDIERPNYQQASEAFRDCETSLRGLRPLLHPEAQEYAVRLIDTMDEALLCFRSDSASSRQKLAGMLQALSPEPVIMAGIPDEDVR